MNVIIKLFLYYFWHLISNFLSAQFYESLIYFFYGNLKVYLLWFGKMCCLICLGILIVVTLKVDKVKQIRLVLRRMYYLKLLCIKACE